MAEPLRNRPQIDREQIIVEALGVLNETSLSGLTMRVLADRLGIRAASLYWHFPNKAALITAISEQLFIKAIENAPDADNWREWMRGLGRAIWDNLIDCPDSGILVMSADPTEEQFARMITLVEQKLEEYDIAPADGLRLHSGIQALTTGWVTFAHSPYVMKLETSLEIKQSAMATLDAMIDGWRPVLKK